MRQACRRRQSLQSATRIADRCSQRGLIAPGLAGVGARHGPDKPGGKRAVDKPMFDILHCLEHVKLGLGRAWSARVHIWVRRFVNLCMRARGAG
jgi:hypothetical protein